MSISCGKRTWRQKLKQRLSRQSASGNLLLEREPPTHWEPTTHSHSHTFTEAIGRQTHWRLKKKGAGNWEDSVHFSSIIISSCSVLRKQNKKRWKLYLRQAENFGQKYLTIVKTHSQWALKKSLAKSLTPNGGGQEQKYNNTK